MRRESRIEGLRVVEDGRVLEAILVDGRRRRLDAGLLWRECPSATGRLRRLDGRHLVTPLDLRIVDLRQVGNYGVNIIFSDGHDRGIYPWAYLIELGKKTQVDDFIIPPSGDANHLALEDTPCR